MIKRYLPFFILLVFICAIDAQEAPKVSIIDITVFKEAVIGKDVQLIDIRTSKEYSAGYIDDARNISIADIDNFNAQFSKLNKEKPVYLYCYSGVRSNRASKKLLAMGFKYVYDFKGGYKAWSNQVTIDK